MKNELEKYLSIEIVEYYDFIISLKNSKDDWKYIFMPNDEYSKITNVGLSSKIYWIEMLYRIHIVVLVSLFKSVKWVDAMNNNIKNYYGFCSSLRGLIESCADSLYTLINVPLTIANDYKAIYEAVNNESPIVLLHEKLEAILLHYIQATKLTKEEKEFFPDFYNAKHITEYLSCFKYKNNEIIELYKFLCGITHPAYESTMIFLFLHEGKTIVCGDSDNLEINLVEDLLVNKNEDITAMFRGFMVNILSILNLLNQFGVSEIITDLSLKYNIEAHEAWKEIDRLMKNSFIKYSEGLKTNNYM